MITGLLLFFQSWRFVSIFKIKSVNENRQEKACYLSAKVWHKDQVWSFGQRAHYCDCSSHLPSSPFLLPTSCSLILSTRPSCFEEGLHDYGIWPTACGATVSTPAESVGWPEVWGDMKPWALKGRTKWKARARCILCAVYFIVKTKLSVSSAQFISWACPPL